MFAIENEVCGAMLILHVTGDILLPVAINFEEEINQHVYAKKLPEVIIDLSGIGRMDNAALGVLVTLSTLYSKQGRRLFFFSQPDTLRHSSRKLASKNFSQSSKIMKSSTTTV